ncbi:hypothetical protein [Halpernia sp.]|uniref:exodeoxyribonuclease X C-terminal domain-containing protein n=1 Tax=Halpernia sp. TaxID=2782209 RepID=UPI003A913CC2
MEYKFNQIINFGKYNGLSIEDIAHKDLGYLCWCVKNITEFILDNETLVFLNENSNSLFNSSYINLDYLLDNDDANVKIKQKKEIENIIKANIIKLQYLKLNPT